MFGWEFPPSSSGGLGTACYGLTRSLTRLGDDITFVLPRPCPNPSFLQIVSPYVKTKSRVKVVKVDSPITPYMTAEEYNEFVTSSGAKKKYGNLYGKDLFAEVRRFASYAREIALDHEHDVIHAHDWLTYLAGIEAKKASGKPLIAHVHATEFDRTGGNSLNSFVYEIERKGMHAADLVITVSKYTKELVMKHYGVPEHKIRIVHNGALPHQYHFHGYERRAKTVLFLGRLTLQKGPDYFLRAAQRVSELDPEARFVIAGSGDMEPRLQDQAKKLGIADKVEFTGFLRDKKTQEAFRIASLYVMPSVSEPFGITALESLLNGTPVIVSRQSGVAEVISHALKVDFWDITELANKIVNVLQHPELAENLAENGHLQARAQTWNGAAEKCHELYAEVQPW